MYRLTAQECACGNTARERASEKTSKKVEKTFEKGIDKRGPKWYNRKVDARAAANDL